MTAIMREYKKIRSKKMKVEYTYKENAKNELSYLEIPMRKYSGDTVSLSTFFTTQHDYLCNWLKKSLPPIVNHLEQLRTEAQTFADMGFDTAPNFVNTASENIKNCLNEVIAEYPKISENTIAKIDSLPKIRERLQHIDYRIKTTTEISTHYDIIAILHETLLAVLLLKEEVASERQAITEYIMQNMRLTSVLVACESFAIISDVVTTPLEYLERAEAALLELFEGVNDTDDIDLLCTAGFTIEIPDDIVKDTDK